jgi:hypothetical protein
VKSTGQRYHEFAIIICNPPSSSAVVEETKGCHETLYSNTYCCDSCDSLWVLDGEHISSVVCRFGNMVNY